jgi:N-acetyltransferase
MTTALPVPTLVGRLVRLEPLSESHADDLVAESADRTTFGWADVPDGAEAVARYIRLRLKLHEAGEWLPFAQVRQADGRAVGCTMLGNFRRRNPFDRSGPPFAAEVGGTWLGASAQRSGINVEAKLLLLTHAFETFDVGRVDIKTDARNERVRTAIAALGAQFEGVLRQWQPSQRVGEEDLLRDSAMFSIVAAEWPSVRERLEKRLLDGGTRPPQ